MAKSQQKSFEVAIRIIDNNVIIGGVDIFCNSVSLEIFMKTRHGCKLSENVDPG